MSTRYRNITPLIVQKEGLEDDHMNIPFYYIEAAQKDTCEKYNELGNEEKKKIAKYEF